MGLPYDRHSAQRYLFRLNATQGNSFSSVIASLQAQYNQIFPDQPFDYFSLDDKMLLDLKPDRTFASVFSVFSGLAILIAVIGIMGLILITVNQSRKDLGVRKVLGAEIHDVSGLLTKQLMFEFMIAMLVALPLSYYGYNQWFLSTYIHRINLNLWFFVLPVLLMAVVIFAVIILLSIRVFQMKLAEVLQYE